MKSHINLLHKEFRPKFVWICSEHFMILVILTLLICLAGYALGVSYKSSQQDSLKRFEQQLASNQKTTEELTRSLEQLTSDPVLKNQLENLKKMSQSKSVLVNHIQDLSTVKQRSFSSLLDSLGQASSNQLWLTGFEFRSNNINLNGKVSTPSALPKWINQLSETEFFKGQEFGQASVEKQQDELTFQLTSMVTREDLALAKNDTNSRFENGEEQ